MLDVILEGRGVAGGEEPEVDIIAIHGLNPRGLKQKEHAYETWTKGGHLWLKDIERIFPRARVMIESYNANPTSSKNSETFLEQAQQVLNDIWVKRQPEAMLDPRRPIIFYMHSLGGLIIKQAMIEAKINNKFEDILESVCGLAFFATPHGGGNSSLVLWGGAATSTWNSLVRNKKTDLLDPLREDRVVTAHLKDHFRHFYEQVQIVSFYERWPTKGHMVVEPSNARLNLGGLREDIVGLNAAHSDVCRFDLKEDNDQALWETVSTHLKDLYRLALKNRDYSPSAPQFLMTHDNRVHRCEFGIALVDYIHEGPGYLDLEFGMIIEDIEFQTDGPHGRCWGRVRSRRQEFRKDHVIFITEPKLVKTLTETRKSSQALYEAAMKFKESHPEDKKPWFIDRLFMKATDKARQHVVWSWPHSYRHCLYVDKYGQLEGDALHVACINRDHLLVEFLLDYLGPDASLARRTFQGYQMMQLGQLDWHELYGTPLLATVNAYHAIRYQRRSVGRDNHIREARQWARLFSILFRHDVEVRWNLWQTFQDDSWVLGSLEEVRHVQANGQSLLESAIYYNDHSTFKRVVDAAHKQHLSINYLPCPLLFNFENCAGFSIKRYQSLTTDETFPVLRVLQMNAHKFQEEVEPFERDLRHEVPKLIWQNIQQLKINEPLMKELLDLVMSQCNLELEQTEWTAGTNLTALLKCKPQPNLQSWAEDNGFATIYHYVVQKNNYSALEALVNHGPIADINMSDENYHTPLDIALDWKYDQIAQLLRAKGGRQSVHTPSKSEQGSASRHDLSINRPSHPSPSLALSARLRAPSLSSKPSSNSGDRQSRVSSPQSVPTQQPMPFFSQAYSNTKRFFSNLNPQARPFETVGPEENESLPMMTVSTPVSIQEALREIGSGTTTNEPQVVERRYHDGVALDTNTERWLYEQQWPIPGRTPTPSAASTMQEFPPMVEISKPASFNGSLSNTRYKASLEQYLPQKDVETGPKSASDQTNASRPQSQRVLSQSGSQASRKTYTFHQMDQQQRSFSPSPMVRDSEPSSLHQVQRPTSPKSAWTKPNGYSRPEGNIVQPQHKPTKGETGARLRSPIRKNSRQSGLGQKGSHEVSKRNSPVVLGANPFNILSDRSDGRDA